MGQHWALFAYFGHDRHLQSTILDLNNCWSISALQCRAHCRVLLSVGGSPWQVWTTSGDWSPEDPIDADHSGHGIRINVSGCLSYEATNVVLNTHLVRKVSVTSRCLEVRVVACIAGGPRFDPSSSQMFLFSHLGLTADWEMSLPQTLAP